MGEECTNVGILNHERLQRIRRQQLEEGFINESWTRDRFFRLCRALHCQPSELAARFFIPPRILGGWLKLNRIPAYAALHFVMLERAYIKVSKAAVAPPRHD